MTITDEILPKIAATIDFEYKSGKKVSMMAIIIGDEKKKKYKVFLRNRETTDISDEEEMVSRSEYGVADKETSQDCWPTLEEARAKIIEMMEGFRADSSIRITQPAEFFEFKNQQSKFAVTSEILRIPRLAPFFASPKDKAPGIDPALLAKIFDFGKSLENRLKDFKKPPAPDSPLEIQKLDSKDLLKKYTKPQLREMVQRIGLNSLERKHGEKQLKEFTKLINLK